MFESEYSIISCSLCISTVVSKSAGGLYTHRTCLTRKQLTYPKWSTDQVVESRMRTADQLDAVCDAVNVLGGSATPSAKIKHSSSMVLICTLNGAVLNLTNG